MVSPMTHAHRRARAPERGGARFNFVVVVLLIGLAAYSAYNAYCGTYSLPEPGVVVHHVELAIHPDQPGMDKRREYVLEGDELVLRTQDVDTAGGPATSELRWRRRG